MKRNNKRIKKKTSEIIGKKISVHTSDNKSDQQKKPKFALEFLSPKYCILKCEKNEKAAFAETLRKLSHLTWAQIFSSGKNQLGFEKIPKYKIKGDQIPSQVKEDTTIIAFRFDNKKAMVGFKSREVFYILWLDRDFSLYEH